MRRNRTTLADENKPLSGNSTRRARLRRLQRCSIAGNPVASASDFGRAHHELVGKLAGNLCDCDSGPHFRQTSAPLVA